MKNKTTFFFIFIAAFVLVVSRAYYEKENPLVLSGRKAVIVAIPATGKDINSPISFLFGRAPYFIICDRSKRTYRAIPNKFMDVQHAAGMRAAQMLVAMNVDAVLGNNVGFEPFRIFDQARIEVYSDVHGTAWQALVDYPDNLTRLTAENVPAHFGITGSKTAVACKTFDTQANAGRIVQGKYFICFNCQYRISENGAGGLMPKKCPRCGAFLHEVAAVAAPLQVDNIKPQVRVL